MTLPKGYARLAKDVIEDLSMDLSSEELLAVAVNIIRQVRDEFPHPDAVTDEVVRALDEEEADDE